jgi:photosystem II stability/assembly factor-like uncharacterized protein
MKLIFFITENLGWIISDNGNVYKTTDGGANFSLISNSSPLVNDLFFLAPLKGWLVTSDGKLYSTTDGGISWNTQVINPSTNLLTVKFANENIGFINHNYKTTDGGITWFQVNQNNTIMLARYADENFGIGLSLDSLYKTTNGGVSWFPFRYLINGYWGFQDITVLDEQTFGIAYRYDETYYAYGTNNGGTDLFIISDVMNSSWDNLGIKSVGIHPVQKNFIAGGFHGWIYHPYKKIVNEFNGHNLHKIHPEDEKNIYAFSIGLPNDSSRIYYSSNKGFNWERIYSNNQFYKISKIFPFKNSWYAVRYDGIGNYSLWKSTDKGRNWFNLRSNDSFILDLFFLNDDLGYVILQNPQSEYRLFKSTDGGLNWTGILTTLGNNINFVGDNGWISLNECSYLKTTDRGETWEYKIVNNCWSIGQPKIKMYNDMYGFMVETYNRFLYTEDGWTTLTRLNFPVSPYENGDFFVLDYRSYDELYIGAGRDGGSNHGPPWGAIFGNKFPLEQVSIKMPSRTIYDLKFLNERIGWACGRGGTLLLFEKEDVIPVELSSFTASVEKNNVHLNWTTSTETNNNGFELQRVNAASMNEEWDVNAFVNGSGTTTEPKQYSFVDENVSHGKYKYRLIQIDYDGTRKVEKEIEVEVNILPKEFALMQNYPNPFNPSTKIKYQVPRTEFITLKIYDILGNEVTTLVNESKEPGEYEIEFDGSKLSSGVYFYTLRSGSFYDTKKFILMK